MASGTEYKLRIVVEGKDAASGPLGKAGGSLQRIGEIAGGMIAAQVFTKIAEGLMKMASAAVTFGKDSVMSAARVEEMDAVIKTLAANQGMAAGTTDRMVASIKDLGITTQSAQWVTAQFVRYQLDSADATNLARLAQDAAVISMQDSSEALQGLMHGIVTMNTRVLRTYGITLASTVTAQDEYAKSLGKTRAQLTTTEKVQAVLNAVLDQGKQITGAYQAAMDTAGKKMRSMKRHVVELMNAVGKPFLNAFGNVVDIFTDLLKGMRYITEEGGVMHDLLANLGLVVDDLFMSLGKADFGFDTFGDHIANLVVPISDFLARLHTFLELVRLFGPESKSAALGLEHLFGPEIAAKITGLIDTIGPVFEQLKEIFGPFFEVVGVQLMGIWDRIRALWEIHGEMILTNIGVAFAAIGLVLSGFVTLGLGIIEGFLALLTGDFDGAWAAVKQGWDNFVDLILGALGTDLETFTQTWKDNLEMVVIIVQDWFDKLKLKLATFVVKMVLAGANLIQGLWDGIQGKITDLMGYLTGALKDVINLVNDIFRNQSPSKVFEGIGENLMQGLVNGIKGGMGDVEGTLSAGLIPVGVGASSGGGVTSNIFHISGGDPREIARQIARELKLQGVQL